MFPKMTIKGAVIMEKQEKVLKVKNLREEYRHPKSVYELIQMEIEIQIMQKKIIEGEKLPSITDMEVKYNAARSTISKIFKIMVKEKIVNYDTGRGYFVCSGAKERLYEKHKKYLEEELEKCLAIADGLGIDLEDYLQARNK